MILHIIPTIHNDVRNDYVMLVPVEEWEDVHYVLATEPVEPCVVERDIVFGGLPAYRRIYDDIIVHSLPA